jgi:hypothetical protein
MLKMLVAIPAVVMLLFFGVFACNAEAAALNGMLGVQPWSTHALVKKATCTEADDFCEQGMHLSCYQGGQGGPGWACECVDTCGPFAVPQCPKKPTCPCDPGRTCPNGLGGTCKCPS